MPPSRILPTTIRARVHEDSITRVTRFFDATTGETLSELFQNARRAGASRVDVTIANGEVRVRDDGRGIRDPAALLAFGRSAWNSETTADEDPAGMGVYSLARRPLVTIRSRPRSDGQAPVPAWEVKLTPNHFVGKCMALIDVLEEGAMDFGTEIVFNDGKANEGHVDSTAYHFPLPVTCNDKPVRQADFLHKAVHVENWHGLRLGVFRSPHHCGRMPEVNFHGIGVYHVDLPRINSMTQHWYIQVDVDRCPDLELVLPARKRVVDSPFVDRLRTRCRTAIYQGMITVDKYIEVSAATRDDALAHGVELPIPEPRLARWEPATGNDKRDRTEKAEPQALPERPLVVGNDMPPCDQQALWRAAQHAGISHRLCAKETRYDGYAWYDRLPRAVRMTTTASVNGEELDINARRMTTNPIKSGRVDRIMFTLHTIEHDGSPGQLRMPSDVAFPEEEPWPDEMSVLVTNDSTIIPAELASLMYNAFFCVSDDAEADSYETQEENYRQTVFAESLELLTSAEEAILSNVRTSMMRSVMPHLPRNATTIIRIEPGKEMSIQIDS